LGANLARGDAYRKFQMLYPGSGAVTSPGVRQVPIFAAGAAHMERSILGGNRSGKSTCAAYELAAHLTGQVSTLVEAEGPITAWASGVDAKTVRESLQGTVEITVFRNIANQCFGGTVRTVQTNTLECIGHFQRNVRRGRDRAEQAAAPDGTVPDPLLYVQCLANAFSCTRLRDWP
jgi:hypothetical protein